MRGSLISRKPLGWPFDVSRAVILNRIKLNTSFRFYAGEKCSVRTNSRRRIWPILTPQGVWSGSARPNGADLFTAWFSTPTVAIINPDNPMPGTKDMTGYLLASAANASAQSTAVTTTTKEKYSASNICHHAGI
jgi:hypothetical protein